MNAFFCLSPPPTPSAPHPLFPAEFRGFPELPAPFLKERRTRGPVQSCVQEIRGISPVFGEVWEYRRTPPQASYATHSSTGVPHVRLSVRGPKTMGEAQPQLCAGC